MAQWKVSPTEGVTNHNNGKFTFVANSPHKIYTISYTDNAGCTAVYSYNLECYSCKDFDCFVKEFNESVKDSMKVSETLTPKTYAALHKLYNEAYAQFYSGRSTTNLPKLYNKDLFPDIYNFYGSVDDDNSKTQAFYALVGFLFGMLLTEVNPEYEISATASWDEQKKNINRGYCMNVGYDFGTNNKDVRIFDYYAFHSDPNVARLIASIIYAYFRSNSDIGGKMAIMRNEMNTVFGTNTFFNDTVIQIHDAHSDAWDYIIMTKDRMDRFMPKAPGPYNSGYSDTGSFPNDSHDATTKNLTKDIEIHNYIVSNYNLDNTTFSGRAVQAISDKEGCMSHFFGEPVTVEEYKFNPVFNHHITARTDNDDSKINKLAVSVARIAEDSRWSSRTMGRLRPGASGTTAYTDRGAFLCNETIEANDGCDTSLSCSQQYTDYALNMNSFPSGHSARGWAATLLLINMVARKSNPTSDVPTLISQLIQEGYSYTVSRTITRYHWTSDIINGRIVGAISYPLLCATRDYDDLIDDAMVNFPI